MERLSAKELVDSAPVTLRREGPPSLVLPYVFDSVEGFSWLDTDDDEVELRGVELKAKIGERKFKFWNVSAREMLSLALEIPKNAHETHGLWFLNTIEKLYEYIAEQKYGRKNIHAGYKSNHPSLTFRSRSEEWRRGVYNAAENASLWEMGVLIESQDNNLGIFSLSVPWDTSYKAWFKRLTPERPFIGREDFLEEFSLKLNGKTLREAEIAETFSATDLDVWWGQAIQANQVLGGDYDEVEMRIRPRYEDRVIDLLKSRIPTREIHRKIETASSISGYFITARESTFPGGVDTTLHLDSENWLQPPPGNKSYRQLLIKSIVDKERNKPPSEKMWTYGCGGLYNAVNDERRNGDFSVFIILGNEEVSQLQISQHIRLNDKTFRDKIFYVNNPRHGDGVSFAKYGPRDRDIRLMRIEDWQTVLKLFEKAKQRAVVDSVVFWREGKTTGLSEKTKAILYAAQSLLDEKTKDLIK